ncbi:class IV adenylate cyclase [Terriglobus sp.]|uniref:class IV adenylate cyclase n=1 Tax=Terriglobus sp. TaxID=1889013 RepID=UPI003AFFD006
MAKAEIEVKFCVPHVDGLLQRASEAGFRLETPRTIERNALFDTLGRDLLRERKILRMRQYGDRWVVTHKRPPADNDDTAFVKERLETETAVEDGEAMGAVFVELGYRPMFRYEKFRTEMTDGAGALVIDETPIGNFAELEGERAWIDAALERLGVSRDLCFTDSYGRMFLDWKERHGSSAENMTFEEIEGARELAAV